jgi:hypothetical protein
MGRPVFYNSVSAVRLPLFGSEDKNTYRKYATI